MGPPPGACSIYDEYASEELVPAETPVFYDRHGRSWEVREQRPGLIRLVKEKTADERPKATQYVNSGIYGHGAAGAQNGRLDKARD